MCRYQRKAKWVVEIQSAKKCRIAQTLSLSRYSVEKRRRSAREITILWNEVLSRRPFGVDDSEIGSGFYNVITVR